MCGEPIAPFPHWRRGFGKTFSPSFGISRKGGFPLLPQRDFSIPTDHHMFKYILNRLTERSTWLGLLALATACGATIEQALADQIIAAGMAVAGLIGIVTKDRKKEQENHDNG
ncbi:hypothetical protein AKMU_11800 [Akkermansia muciniphila]|nr:hypothetical protein AKMU_11800 [Akkermansia muciniphila]